MPKRRPVNNLNHDNWDDEVELEEPGKFVRASDDVLKSRVIKTVKRRNYTNSIGVESTDNVDSSSAKSVFSNFSGFGKTSLADIKETEPIASSPFAFLSKLNSSTNNINGTNTTNTGSGFKMTTTSTTSTIGTTNITGGGTIGNSTKDKSTEYYGKIKGLNLSISEWIAKNVAENPLCILTPIFDEYKKYLNEIEIDENKKPVTAITSTATTNSNTINNNNSSTFRMPSVTPSSTATAHTANLFQFSNSTKPITSIFEMPKTASTSPTLGGNAFSSSTATESSPTKPFSFGNSSTLTAFSTPPSKVPFTFTNVVQQPSQNTGQDDDGTEKNDEEPPKNDFTPVIESDSLYSKRCKVFIKNKESDGYLERGVGTLYLKSIDNDLKTQLLVRADTNLGNILINLLLTDAMPIQRTGKNNVMLIGIPTPDSVAKPTTILIRVKTETEADEVLEQMNKYKK